jgi:cell wall-associated NlpC family hydrolase
MKRSGRTYILLTALAVLLLSMAGFAKSVQPSSKSSTKPKRVKVSRKASPARVSDQVYIVHRGDNLFQIARAHQVKVSALKAANGLKSSRIKAGQKLTLPIPQSAYSPKKTAPKPSAPVEPVEQAATQKMSQLQDQNLISQDELGSIRSRLVEAGFQMIGVRYRYSGGSEKTGFDCSGLVKSLFSKFNIDLPRSSREQYKQGEKVDRDKLEVGDLVFFSSGGTRPTHVGIYIGNDRFLHAARKARQVMVSDLGKLWYTMRYLGARRIADLWGEEPESNSEKQQ